MNRSMRTISTLLAGLAVSTSINAFECTNSGAAAAVPTDNDITDALACGNAASSSATGASALGYNASAFGNYGVALGAGSQAGNSFAISAGWGSEADGQRSIAIGEASDAQGDSAIALGQGSIAMPQGSTTLGNKAMAGVSAAFSTALGYYAQVDQSHSIVLGAIAGVNNATVNADVAIGTTAPMAPLHIFRDDDTQEMLFLESDEAGGPQDRAMMYLVNNGGIRFEFSNPELSTAWRFQAATGNDDQFEIAKVGTGVIEMAVDAAGNLAIQGTLTEMSDRAAKQDVEPLAGETVLERLAAVPVSEWAYRNDPGSRHVGPMAQDFHAAFGLGDDERRLSPRDMAGVNMAAIQALEQRNRSLEGEVVSLRDRLARLEALLVAATE